MVHENRHIINCLCDDYDSTLLMDAVFWDNDGVFDYLIKKSQDFSVTRNGWNIIHFIAWFGRDEIRERALSELQMHVVVCSKLLLIYSKYILIYTDYCVFFFSFFF